MPLFDTCFFTVFEWISSYSHGRLNPVIHFFHPITCIIAGPTQSGKTVFTKKLLRHCQEYVSPPPTRIIWCFGESSEAQFQELQNSCSKKIEFVAGLPDLDDISVKDNNLLILDDLMVSAGNSTVVSNIFTKTSHHKNLSVVLIVQNIFHKGKMMREISLNAKYLVIFKNPRDKAQINHLAHQIYPSNSRFIINAYQQATDRPHGYLLFDFDQRTIDTRRFITGVFPPEFPIAYIPKK